MCPVRRAHQPPDTDCEECELSQGLVILIPGSSDTFYRVVRKDHSSFNFVCSFLLFECAAKCLKVARMGHIRLSSDALPQAVASNRPWFLNQLRQVPSDTLYKLLEADSALLCQARDSP